MSQKSFCRHLSIPFAPFRLLLDEERPCSCCEMRSSTADGNTNPTGLPLLLPTGCAGCSCLLRRKLLLPRKQPSLSGPRWFWLTLGGWGSSMRALSR